MSTKNLGLALLVFFSFSAFGCSEPASQDAERPDASAPADSGLQDSGSESGRDAVSGTDTDGDGFSSGDSSSQGPRDVGRPDTARDGMEDIDEEPAVQSYPRLRPPPQASDRPMGEGPGYFVAVDGDDDNDGSLEHPWKTVKYGAKQLTPGDTLYLRGGTHYVGHIQLEDIRGTESAPITFRSYPGELAIIDHGHREFYESPADAWEPVPADEGGAPDEYRSTRDDYDEMSGYMGWFGDSMVPLIHYTRENYFRADNEFWYDGFKTRTDPIGLYSGPGLWRNKETGRIHIRLSHHQLEGLGERAYRGETDPRRLPLIISGPKYGLRFYDAEHLRVQDLVLRGASKESVHIRGGRDIEFDGLTIYSATKFGVHIRYRPVDGFRFIHSAIRGIGAPWHSWAQLKHVAITDYMMSLGESDHVEIAYNEFTDDHDALLLRDAQNADIHHNLLDNINDDAIEPGPRVEGTTRKILVHENLLTNAYNSLTAHITTEPVDVHPDSGLYVYRNIFDLRGTIYKKPPAESDPSGGFLYNGDNPRVLKPHNSPVFPIYRIYHNTVIANKKGFRDLYLLGLSNYMKHSERWVYNNIFVQVEGVPKFKLNKAKEGALWADHNLYWSLNEPPPADPDHIATALGEQRYRDEYPEDMGAHDFFGDPSFMQQPAVERGDTLDVRLRPESAAINRGHEAPDGWPDSLRDQDEGAPDVGALPLGADMLKVGPQRGTAMSN